MQYLLVDRTVGWPYNISQTERMTDTQPSTSASLVEQLASVARAGREGEEQFYTDDDLELVDTHSLSVLIAVARQNGRIDIEWTVQSRGDVEQGVYKKLLGDADDRDLSHLFESNSETDNSQYDSVDDVDIATTSTVQTETGLDRMQVNYRLKKLSGEGSPSVSSPLLKTELPDIPESGKMPAKEISLTEAGKQLISNIEHAIDHGGFDEINQLSARRGPPWLTPDSDIDQTVVVANRVHALERRVYNLASAVELIAYHLGFASVSELIDISTDPDQSVDDLSAVVADADATEPLIEQDKDMAAQLAYLIQGLRATQSSLSAAESTPPASDFFTPPQEYDSEPASGETPSSDTGTDTGGENR